MKTLKKPIKPLNYQEGDEVVLYASMPSCSAVRPYGGGGGGGGGTTGCNSSNPFTVTQNPCSSSSNLTYIGGCDGLCSNASTTPPNCGPTYSCSSSAGTLQDGCSGWVGVPGGCLSILCADGAMVSTPGYFCDAELGGSSRPYTGGI